MCVYVAFNNELTWTLQLWRNKSLQNISNEFLRLIPAPQTAPELETTSCKALTLPSPSLSIFTEAKAKINWGG